MTSTLADANAAIAALWPLDEAEEWDAPGLLVGGSRRRASTASTSPSTPCSTPSTRRSAAGAQLLVVHHPLLLRGVTAVAEDRYKGAVIARLIRAGCALVAAHTNADVVARGTSAVLAERLGLIDTRPIVPGDGPGPRTRAGRTARRRRRRSARSRGRSPTCCRPRHPGSGSRGSSTARSTTVALCAGAGDSLLSHPEVVAADVYITSDLRHHPASEAAENARVAGGPALIDVSHWASEWLWLEVAAEQLREALPGVEVTVSELRTDPWDFAILQ